MTYINIYTLQAFHNLHQANSVLRIPLATCDLIIHTSESNQREPFREDEIR